MTTALDKPLIQFNLEGKLSDKSFYLPGIFTFEEYLAIHEDRIISEWLNGKVLIMAAASVAHQRIGSFLEVLMRLYVEKKQLGEVFRSPIAVKINIFVGREPDLFFISQENKQIIKPTFIDGVPDLAVEIISPESVKRDREEKFDEYQTAGVKEYWLIDPDRKSCDFYSLQEGKFELLAKMKSGVFQSQVITGFAFKIENLWEAEAPTLEALRDLKLI